MAGTEYFQIHLADKILQAQKIYGIFADDAESFTALDGYIYDFTQISSRKVSGGTDFLLRQSDSVHVQESRVFLSTDAEYSEEYFVQAFSVPPLVSPQYILAIDRNYSLFIIPHSSFESDVTVLRRSLPSAVYNAKSSAKMIPFGRMKSSVSGAYFNQPALMVLGDRIIIVTGEGEPNFAVCYASR